MICNKLDNYFVVFADRQTILGFEMTANLRDTFPLHDKLLEREGLGTIFLECGDLGTRLPKKMSEETCLV